MCASTDSRASSREVSISSIILAVIVPTKAIAAVIAIIGCAEIKLPIPLKVDVPAAFNFPKAPVASPTAVFTPVIAVSSFGNDNSKRATISLNDFKPPPASFKVDLNLNLVCGKIKKKRRCLDGFNKMSRMWERNI